jgi:hypothetical protein
LAIAYACSFRVLAIRAPLFFDLVELRLTEETLFPPAREAVAVIRGSDGDVLTVSARMLRAAQELA